MKSIDERIKDIYERIKLKVPELKNRQILEKNLKSIEKHFYDYPESIAESLLMIMEGSLIEWDFNKDIDWIKKRWLKHCELVKCLKDTKYIKDPEIEKYIFRFIYIRTLVLSDVISEQKCKDLYEICEVASLDLPGGYKPIKWLGEGGSGSVYLVENTADHLKEAVKILDIPADKGSPEDIARAIESELKVRRLNTLRCPYIPIYYSVTPHKGKYLISMEPYEKTLEDRLEETKGRLPLPEAMRYFEQLCQALALCHKNGIVHKDLAPHNVGIDAEGNIKLCDFGDPLYTIDKRSKEGPLDYSSPRLLALTKGSWKVKPEDNVWALGVMLYEMLTGELPFSDPSIPRDKRAERRECIRQKQKEFQEKGSGYLLDRILVNKEEAKDYAKKQFDLNADQKFVEYNLKKIFEAIFKHKEGLDILLFHYRSGIRIPNKFFDTEIYNG